MDFEDRKDGSCGVTYNVSEPGGWMKHLIFIQLFDGAKINVFNYL